MRGEVPGQDGRAHARKCRQLLDFSPALLDIIRRANRSDTHVSSQKVSALNFIPRNGILRALWGRPRFPPSSVAGRFPGRPARRGVSRPASKAPPAPGFEFSEPRRQPACWSARGDRAPGPCGVLAGRSPARRPFGRTRPMFSNRSQLVSAFESKTAARRPLGRTRKGSGSIAPPPRPATRQTAAQRGRFGAREPAASRTRARSRCAGRDGPGPDWRPMAGESGKRRGARRRRSL